MAQFKRSESLLASRHRELGSNLEDWNGSGAAWSYSSDPCDEHDAYRETATLTDMVGLKKVWVRGPDAFAVVDHACSRTLSNVGTDKCAYTLLLTEEGTVTDDAIVYNMGDKGWLVVHAAGEGTEMLQASAQGKNATVELDDSFTSISLQGPASLGILNPLLDADIDSMGVFGKTDTKMFGHDVMISRTGFSGERGYEIYTDNENICEIWDKILEAGKEAGVIPASFTSLNKARMEYGLLFYPYDQNESINAWELNLPWAVDLNKDFRGREALIAKKGQDKVNLITMTADINEAMPDAGKLYSNGDEVGEIRCAVHSHRMGIAISNGYVKPGLHTPDTKLECRGEDGSSVIVTVVAMPLYDPLRKKMRG